ncbi:hypothetical protein ONE63_003401 [Megalurothrips usitatus]|uniref:Uncharacterized protein n=1 Tax=Megalurothrips usitatus TaxID=439358 RepID=A0AAV7XDR5_9NEOP|nr:hypothetical protein ONE63_003401 [Megalurothrips usitatus]
MFFKVTFVTLLCVYAWAGSAEAVGFKDAQVNDIDDRAIKCLEKLPSSKHPIEPWNICRLRGRDILGPNTLATAYINTIVNCLNKDYKGTYPAANIATAKTCLIQAMNKPFKGSR